MADDQTVDLNALGEALTREKRGYAIEMAQGDFANHDRYEQIARRLRYLDEARGGGAEVAKVPTPTPTPTPVTKSSAPSAKDK